MRQGLRFAFDVADIGDLYYDEETNSLYYVQEVGALVILKNSLKGQEMIYSNLGKLAGLTLQKGLLDIIVGEVDYKSAYIYNIPQSAKDTMILARAYIKAVDYLGNVRCFYTGIQEKSLTDVFVNMDNEAMQELHPDVIAW